VLGEAEAAKSAGPSARNPRRTTMTAGTADGRRATAGLSTFNLLLGDHDWLVLELLVSRRHSFLNAAQHVRSKQANPVGLEAVEVDLGASHRSNREHGIRAIKDLERRWRHEPLATAAESQRVAFGFLFAFKLLSASYAALLLHERNTGPDIALALPDEELAAVLARMEGQCRPESFIARPRRRLGRWSFQLLETRPTDR
jgi:hypothetical protein